MTPSNSAPVPLRSARRPAARVAPSDIHALAPALGWYSDEILFGEEWENSDLSKRDRSFVTVSALVSRAFAQQLTGHFNRALNHGIEPVELVELVTHLAFYAGWPCAMTAFGVMKQVFADRNIFAEQISQTISAGLSQYSLAPLTSIAALAEFCAFPPARSGNMRAR